ncbi:MAG: CpaF family protein [Myxococcota bacterium]
MLEGLTRPLPEEPDGTPPQRGFIDAMHSRQLRSVLRLAETIGKKAFGVADPLNANIKRTDERERIVASTIQQMVTGGKLKFGNIPSHIIVELVLAELFGLGPLDRFLGEDDVTEIMVNGPFIIFVERAGKLIETGHKFVDDEHVERIINRIVRPLGRTIGPNNPLVDARLPDGSRVNAAVAPCTLDGPSITIRKFSSNMLHLDALVGFGSMSQEMAMFMKALVRGRRNIVISGGTGSGKTTLINALSAYIDPGERVVTIEDAAELQLRQRNVVRMESKKPTREDPVEVTMRDCLVNALRMRPERILIGECRSIEAFDMLQAMNTGHDGSMTTVHANSPRDAIARLETLALMGGVALPLPVMRRQLVSAVHFIIQVQRMQDGKRRITHITEIQGMEGEIVTLGDIFIWDETRRGQAPRHRATGNRPRCIGELQRYGQNLPAALFNSRR